MTNDTTQENNPEPTRTPGRWTRQHNVSGEPTIVAEDMNKHPVPNGSFIIAQTFGPDTYANADFLAAAPEMLEALEAARSLLADFGQEDTNNWPVFQQIIAAIAKAKAPS